MYTLKAPSFLRPASRPSSPSPTPARPDTATPVDRSSRPSVLSFSSFKRTASPLTRPSSSTPFAPLVQDGSYMESLNLKLSEAVSKTLAQPAGPGVPTELLNGRRPIPAGRGRAFADLIVSYALLISSNIAITYPCMQRDQGGSGKPLPLPCCLENAPPSSFGACE